MLIFKSVPVSSSGNNLRWHPRPLLFDRSNPVHGPNPSYLSSGYRVLKLKHLIFRIGVWATTRQDLTLAPYLQLNETQLLHLFDRLEVQGSDSNINQKTQ